ncbi:MAG TPA: glycosyltransferase 87 family protein, partial [Candidatus Limnocylindrales bacterium]|nr:glycosyltransferase 87 family protein [Candidatus Limnocylindrales bacterium]
AAPYANADWTSPIAYVYSPAFLQLVSPLTSLPWQVFIGMWTAILLAAVAFLTGPRLLALGVAVPAMELAGGNISLLLAVAIVLGFRWPALWAFVLLTKITPGIGLLWFAVRREWRSLGIALGATLAVVVVSAFVLPHAWMEWFGVLATVGGRDGTWAAIPIPLWARLPVAIAVVVWGARTDRRWAVPVASMIALPALWYGGLSMLLAVFALSGERGVSRRSADDRAASGDARRAPGAAPAGA